MSRHLFSADAAEDLEQLVNFLLDQHPEDAIATIDVGVRYGAAFSYASSIT